MNTITRFLRGFSGTLVLASSFAGLTGCNDTGFVTAAPSRNIAQVDPLGPGCTVTDTTKDVRIIFMVDQSTSTNTTDPNKVYRVQTLQRFISDYGSRTNLSYNFGYFNGTSGKFWDKNLNQFINNVAANPILNSAQLTTAVNAFNAMAASSNTPYKGAFKSMSDTIIADEAAGHKQDYAVVFLSDGQPTDISGAANLNKLVTDLKVTAGGNGSLLTVSTVYFGESTDSTSIANLQGMATAGGGKFVNTNTTTNLDIGDLITVPGDCQ